MRFYELELNGETIKFRLTSNDCMVIESKTGKNIAEYVQEMSMTTIINLLMYMRRSDVPNFSQKDATELYDKLIDNGYTLETIVSNILLEGLCVSGFMSKADLENMMEAKNKTKEQIKEQMKK